MALKVETEIKQWSLFSIPKYAAMSGTKVPQPVESGIIEVLL